MRAREAGIAVLLLAMGCVSMENQLWPSTEAHVIQGEHRVAAVADEQGVHLLADGNAWKGYPSDLERRLTPIYVRLENGSGRPLRLSYSDFSLVGQTSRFRYTAIPPLSPRTPSVSSSPGSYIEPTSWHVGVSGWYGWGWGWGLGWGWGPYWGWGSPYFGAPWYGPYPYSWGYSYEVPLPTEDMLTRALPDGVLEPGGALDGFLYFQGVIRRENAVSLQVQLVDARTNEHFGTLDIPFQVHKG
ncbi:hypothetical protein [Pyxidicoccus sp. MSG2]|uniref:hypothetical protein n=1 Tax=Pyxidicoccus sp. MSG2 TaxID=2996790 RepID=UPI002270A280|nr:hypothetical protein [Pyxidicoccus sp. MSG2]MCY1023788.1 hypothetical protein [Pyxidicoccus sp. MSG2]